MAITRSRAGEREAFRRAPAVRLRGRAAEALGLVAAGLLVAAALYAVYRARTVDFAEAEKNLVAGKLTDLNELSAREKLLPVLAPVFADSAERDLVLRRIFDASGSLSNVGSIAALRVRAEELQAARSLAGMRDRLHGRASMPLVDGEQLRQLKPLLVVRRPAQFRRAFWLWTGMFFAAFLLTHLWWNIRGFAGDQIVLPALLLLTGAGLALMVSLRDPLRDTLLFVDFAQGAAAGALIMAVASSLDFERLLGKLSFVPLLGSFTLSVLLVLFGSGPGLSDAKVNLFGFQPVEVIRLLLLLFLAGYFARRWDVLRHARESRPKLAALTSRVDIPPVEFTLPVLASVVLSLGFFFLQKDMGPALVFACLFLVLYGVARGSVVVPAAGLLLLALGFFAGYLLGVPHTVGDRVAMWLSPWDNLARGGDQLAHSLWAFSTGGLPGMGIGHGDAQVVPAAHTDLILAALGEEWGFLGLAAVFGIYALLVYRSLRISLQARNDYEFFLACGIGAATALQILLIAGGSLGLLPLSGVVTPFLSYGRTSMLLNFVLMAMLLSISAKGSASAAAETSPARAFSNSVKILALVFAIAGGAVVAKAAWVQVVRDEAVMGAGTLVVQGDGARRYQYNPRFQEVMRQIPKGTVYDRNGLPLATSSWDELEKHRAAYQQLGIDIDRACPRTDARYYPLGGITFDLLGDLRTRLRWGAGNTAFVERDSARRLRGYDDRPTLVAVKNPKTGATDRVIRYDYRELVPLLRHRSDPQSPEVRRVLDRPRNLKLSIDARFQVRVTDILRAQLKQANQEKGSAVVLDPATGDLLAAVSLPLPPDTPAGADILQTDTAANPYLDRARFGLYPPGSTFKVVTAIAALRKDPALTHQTYQCQRLPDGRVGNFLKGSKRPIRDDVQDAAPHGTVDMEKGITVSCNAYFAQLGTYDVGAASLFDTATLFSIATAQPNSAGQLEKSLPQSAYGQGQVVASPFQMARV
jgi:cell division protein FtsW (lipid II flippase)